MSKTSKKIENSIFCLITPFVTMRFRSVVKSSFFALFCSNRCGLKANTPLITYINLVWHANHVRLHLTAQKSRKNRKITFLPYCQKKTITLDPPTACDFGSKTAITPSIFIFERCSAPKQMISLVFPNFSPYNFCSYLFYSAQYD